MQDFEAVSEYNSALFKISSRLKLCKEKITDEDMLKKNVHNVSPLMCAPAAVI